MENFEPVDVKFIINSDQVKAESEKVKQSLLKIGYTAEEAEAKINTKFKNSLTNNALKGLESLEKQGKRTKTTWNGLGNSINQISREGAAFAVSAQTGFLAISNNLPILADEINRLKVANDALVASGGKAVPIWKQVLKGILSWQTAMSIGITLLTVYGKEVGIYIKALFKGKKALDEFKLRQDSLNNAIKSSDYLSSVKDLMQLRSQIDLAKKGFIDKQVALESYNKTLGEVYKKTNDINVAEQNVINKAPAYIEAMLYKAAAAAATAEAAQKIAENAKKEVAIETKISGASTTLTKRKTQRDASLERIKSGNATATDFSKATKVIDTETYITSLEGDLKKLEKKGKEIQDKSQKIVTNLNKKAAEVASAAGLNIFKSNKNITSAINARQSLLDKITAIDNQYSRKSFTKDEEELQALKDKFNAVKEQIKRFNKDPKNIGKEIDSSGLLKLENKATSDLLYRQDTEKLKEDLSKKKQIFSDFETAKKQLGVEKASEMYADQMDGFDSYLEYIQNQAWQQDAAFEAVKNGNATGVQTERVTLFNTAETNETQAEKDKYIELLAVLQNYEEKRNLLIRDYQEKRNQLVAAGASSEVKELDRQHKESLDKLDLSHAKGTKEYKALIAGVENLSTSAARVVIKNARSMVRTLVKAGKLTAEAAAKINKEIDKLQKEVDEDGADKIQKIAAAIGQVQGALYQLSDAVGGFDEGLSDSLDTMGDMAGIGADAVSAFASFSSGDILGGITSTISALSGLFSIGAKARESERIANEEILQWQQEIFASQIAYNSELRKRIIFELRLNDIYKSRAENIKEELAANQSNSAKVLQDQQAVFDKLLHAETIVDKKKYKSGGFLGIGSKTKVKDIKKTVAELLNIGEATTKRINAGFGFKPKVPDWIVGTGKITDEIFDTLEKINAEKALTGDAKDAYDQLVKLRDEYGSIEEANRELEKQLKDAVTGTTASALADSIKQGVLEGKKTFADFADDIEGFLRNAMIAGMSTKIIEPQIQALQDKLYGFLDDGIITADEQKQFEEIYKKIADESNAYLDLINQTSLGEGLFEEANTEGLSASISRMTEETGDEIAGITRATHDITKEHKQIAQAHYDVARQSYDVLNRNLLANERTATNTENTVTELKNLIKISEEIKENTTPSSTSRDLGY